MSPKNGSVHEKEGKCTELYAKQYDVGMMSFEDGRELPALQLTLEDDKTKVYGLFSDREDMMRLFRMLESFLFPQNRDFEGYV